MQPQRPPFWEWPLDRLNVTLLTGALLALLLLSVVNYRVQHGAAQLTLATPTPLAAETVLPAAPTAAPQATADVSTPVSYTHLARSASGRNVGTGSFRN